MNLLDVHGGVHNGPPGALRCHPRIREVGLPLELQEGGNEAANWAMRVPPSLT